MKRGKDYGKADYYDFELMKRIANKRLRDALEACQESEISKIYLDEKVVFAAKQGHDDGIYSGVDLVRRIITIFRNYGYRTEIIAASVRNARQVREMAELEVDIVTTPFYVLKEMLTHPKTVEGVKLFTADVVPQYAKIVRAGEFQI